MEKILNTLLELGFSPNDAAVYFALAEHGPCNAGPVIQATNFHRNVVYSSIQHLEARKLVTEKIINGRKRFSVTSPKVLVDEFENKAALAKEMKDELEKLLNSQSEEIVVYEGRKDYLALLSSLLDALKPNSIEYIWGTANGQLFNKYIKSWNKAYLEKLKKAKSQVRIIAYKKDKEKIEADIKRLPGGRYDVRYLEDDLPDPYVLDVYPDLDTVLQNIYSSDGQSVTAIKITNAQYAKGCLELCEKLWERAKRIE